MEKTQVTKQMAKSLAEAAAESWLEGIVLATPSGLIDSRVEEAEHCWMFFQHRDIHVPAERSLRISAYAVAKDPALGVRCVPDYRGNEQRLQEYLLTISDFFGRGAPVSR